MIDIFHQIIFQYVDFSIFGSNNFVLLFLLYFLGLLLLLQYSLLLFFLIFDFKSEIDKFLEKIATFQEKVLSLKGLLRIFFSLKSHRNHLSLILSFTFVFALYLS